MSSGRTSSLWLLFLASAGVMAGLIGLLAWPEKARQAEQSPLIVYCAAGIRVPVEAAAAEYQQAYGVAIQFQFLGSNTLLANAKASQVGDLFLPADDSYIQLARQDALLEEVIPLARMRPVLAVKKGNPKGIGALEDLLKKGIKLGIANPDAAAIGLMSRQALEKAGQWEAIKARIAVEKGTVNDVAADIKVGAVDAGFVWDATVRQMANDLEAIEVPAFAGTAASIPIAVLKQSKQPTAALRFARYLASRDKGLGHFKQAGFEPVEGDVWAFTPELTLFSGAMLQPAIEQTIGDFEKREGAKVVRVYNGCGILVSQMKQGQRPDAYFSCDRSFMRQVKDLFMDEMDVSANQIVIVTLKGNPRQVKVLEDLGRPGLKVGVGHEEQSALGVLTKNMLVQAGCYEAVMKNAAVQSATGDHLINQLRTGSLDAVLVYISNAAKCREQVEVIQLQQASAKAIQPFAVGRSSDHKHLAQRLLKAITTATSKRQFEELGFQWQVPAE